MRYSFLAVPLIALALAGCAENRADAPAAPDIAQNAPALQRHIGLAVEDMDTAIRPGDDFYRYANGLWQDGQAVPDGYTSYGTLTRIHEQAANDVAKLIEDAAASGSTDDQRVQRFRDVYAAYRDTAAIEERGITPLALQTAIYNRMETHSDVALAMMRPDMLSQSIVDFSVRVDARRPGRFIGHLAPSGLGMKNPAAYIEPAFAERRAAYEILLREWLVALDKEGAADRAKAVIALETEIARTHRSDAFYRNEVLKYYLYPTEDLEKLAPQFPWKEIWGRLGIAHHSEWVVQDPAALTAMGVLLEETPVPVWRDFLLLHSIKQHADILPRPFENPYREFRRDVLEDPAALLSRRQRGLLEADKLTAPELGQVYSETHFTQQSKAAAIEIVGTLRASFGKKLGEAQWLTSSTRNKAQEKLGSFSAKIAYPDRWPDLGAFLVLPDDPVGNRTRGHWRQFRADIAKLDSPNTGADWSLSPHTVDAFYAHDRNEIVFPAAMLQPPFFDTDADPAVNFGAIGAVMGHEISHAFDSNGRMTDANGFVSDWWNRDDKKALAARTDRLRTTLEATTGADGVNSDLILEETISDIVGLLVAYDAYRTFTKDQPPEIIEGLTGDQRFFLAWAQIMKRNYRPEERQRRLLTDPHPPSSFRVNAALRHIDAWYTAFDIVPQDPLYLSPSEREVIW